MNNNSEIYEWLKSQESSHGPVKIDNHKMYFDLSMPRILEDYYKWKNSSCTQVAITGEMGSGKSRCLGLFSTLGVPVFVSDIEAKKLMTENDDVKFMLKKMISPDIYDENDKIIKGALQHKLFECIDAAQNRKALDLSLYAYLKTEYEKFLDKYKHEKYVIMESAILFETKWDGMFDRMIYVDCPAEIRKERVKKRSNMSSEQQTARTAHMMDPREKMAMCHFVINNDGIEDLDAQVQHIHDEIIKIPKSIR